MSAPSLVKQITKRPWLHKWIAPLAEWYREAAGYRKLGLRCVTALSKPFQINPGVTIGHWKKRYSSYHFDRADDLIPEESETVLLALKRLPPKEAYDRVFRIRRAFQVLKPRPKLGDNQLINRQCSLSHQILPKDQQTKPEDASISFEFLSAPAAHGTHRIINIYLQ